MRDNLRQRRSIERSYVQAIGAARRQVDIVSAYFYPDRSIRTLRDAARRGVRVRLLLQGKWDYRMAELAAHALCDELLSYGVQIHEYTAAFLHAKVAVVDDDWATVGSSNIDPLSLLLNLEGNVVVQDPAFAGALAPRDRRRDRAVGPGHCRECRQWTAPDAAAWLHRFARGCTCAWPASPGGTDDGYSRISKRWPRIENTAVWRPMLSRRSPGVSSVPSRTTWPLTTSMRFSGCGA